MTPKGFSGGWLHAQEEGFSPFLTSVMHGLIALEDGEIEASLDEKRTCREGPLEGELAVILFDISTPERLALQVEGGKVAVAVEKDDEFAVGDRRGRGIIAAFISAQAIGNLRLPAYFAVSAVEALGVRRLVVLIHGGEEDAVPKNDRSGRTGAGHGSRPKDPGFFGELAGQALFRRGAVEFRASPLRPVFRVEFGERRVERT